MDESPQDREDRITTILHLCSHWVDPDAAHPNNGLYRDQSGGSAGHFRPGTNRTRAWPLPATLRRPPHVPQQGSQKSLLTPRLAVDQMLRVSRGSGRNFSSQSACTI